MRRKTIIFIGRYAFAILLVLCLRIELVDASGNTRTISLYHIHTKEELTILYKKDGQYIPEALKKVNWFLRDWRKNEVIEIDPKTIDIAWEMHEELGSQLPIYIICGYRSNNTNEMLRKTRGGQAKKSQHISGKAIDLAFPDIPISRLRYSAIIREHGGVGYYPTSAIPFVHIDTGHVRSWPRLPHEELALLFPHGHTKHISQEGKMLQPGDFFLARKHQPQLAQEVAQYFDQREHLKKGIQIASTDISLNLRQDGEGSFQQAKIKRSSSIENDINQKIKAHSLNKEVKVPQLLQEPRLVERSSHFSQSYSKEDRTKLSALVSQTALSLPQMDTPHLIGKPQLVSRGEGNSNSKGIKNKNENGKSDPFKGSVSVKKSDQGASVIAGNEQQKGKTLSPISPNTWIISPTFDEDHPDELSYQPFPILSLLTTSSSPDDPTLTYLMHPNVGKILEMIDDQGTIAPMRFRPGIQTAQLFFAQKFMGKVVDLSVIEEETNGDHLIPPPGFVRKVHTTPQD